MKEVYHRPDSVEIRKSPVHGIGVFAKRDIARKEIIEECFIVVINALGEKDFYEHVDENLMRYLYTCEERHSYITNKMEELVAIPLGIGSCFNHHDKFNVDYIMDVKNKLFTYVAHRDINQDEELFIRYDKERELMAKPEESKIG